MQLFGVSSAICLENKKYFLTMFSTSLRTYKTTIVIYFFLLIIDSIDFLIDINQY